MDFEEEMKKFREGFRYKPPQFSLNLFRALSEKLKSRVVVIPDDLGDTDKADQLAAWINYYRERVDNE